MTGVLAEIWEEGREQGLEQGLEQGENNASNRIALKMIASGQVTQEQIAEFTSLPLEQVQALAAQQASLDSVK